MEPFVGRDRELNRLDAELIGVRTDGRGRLLAVRGRRQVGKSTLVERFLDRGEAPAVFHVGSQQSGDRELALFAEAVAGSGLRAAEVARSGGLTTWEAALALVAAEASRENPVVIVLDEFPYLVQSVPGFEGLVQRMWDTALARLPVLMILVGSDIRMMEALGGYGRPLFGRVRELVVPPLDPAATAALLGLGPAAALDAHLVTGGLPRLIARWPAGAAPAEVLAGELADPTSPLVVLGERSLAAELPGDVPGRRVLEAIGAGERAYAALAQRVGVPQTTLTRTLDLLIDKGLVTKELPYSARRRPAPPRYRVADPYLRFWLRFLGPGLALIERGRGDLVARAIAGAWPDHRGRAMEPLVRGAVERMLPDERFGDALHVGGFWTRDNGVEVDLVGGAEPGSSARVAFVGSVKWRERAPFDRDDLARLVDARARVPGADASTSLVGVSRAGFAVAGLDVELGPADILSASGGDAGGGTP